MIHPSVTFYDDRVVIDFYDRDPENSTRHTLRPDEFDALANLIRTTDPDTMRAHR